MKSSIKLTFILVFSFMTVLVIGQSSLTATDDTFTIEITEVTAKDPLAKATTLFVNNGVRARKESVLTYFRDDTGLVTLQCIVEYKDKNYIVHFDGVEVLNTKTVAIAKKAIIAIFYDRIQNKKFKD